MAQLSGTHLKDQSAWAGTLVNRVGELEAARLRELAHSIIVVELAIAELPFQQVIKIPPRRYEALGETEQLNGALVDHGNLAIGIYHEDALAHVLQGVGQNLLGTHELPLRA